MARMNWDKIHVEDKDWRHRMSMEVRYETSNSLTQEVDKPNTSINKMSYTPDRDIKFKLVFNFYLPPSQITMGWLVIHSMPNAIKLFPEIADSLYQHKNAFIKSGNLLRDIIVDLSDSPFPSKQQNINTANSPINSKSKKQPTFSLIFNFKIPSSLSISQSLAELISKFIRIEPDQEFIEWIQIRAIGILRRKERALELEVSYEVENE